MPTPRSALETSVEGDLMGGDRYEQMFRATGSVRVAGEEVSFTGSGLRIRRQGVRRLEGFWGHCWQSALFPQRPRIRLHRLPAASRRQAHLQRGLFV